MKGSHTRFPCPSPSPRAYSNSHPFSQWCHPTISSSELESPEELVNMQIWIPWVLEGPENRSFQQVPNEATAEGLWTTQGTARPQPWGGGPGGSGEPAIQSYRPLLHYKHEMMHCIRCAFYGSSSPQLHPSPPSHCTGNLHNSKQHKSLLIKVLQRNWNGNKKQGWLCEHSSYWSVCIITVSFKHKKKYIICCLSLSEWMRMLVHTF